MSTTTSVRCPGLVCRDQASCTDVVDATYTARQVSVAPCESLIAQGWTGPQWVATHGQALERLVPAVVETVVSHVDGLVSFR